MKRKAPLASLVWLPLAICLTATAGYALAPACTWDFIVPASGDAVMPHQGECSAGEWLNLALIAPNREPFAGGLLHSPDPIENRPVVRLPGTADISGLGNDPRLPPGGLLTSVPQPRSGGMICPPVPEPAAAVLLGLGLLALAGIARRRELR